MPSSIRKTPPILQSTPLRPSGRYQTPLHTPILKISNGGLCFTLPVNRQRDADLIESTLAHKLQKTVRFSTPVFPNSKEEEGKRAYQNRQPLPTYNSLATLEAVSSMNHETILASIAPNTRSSYQTGYNHHKKFSSIMGTNVDLSQSPIGWEMFSLEHPQYKNFKEAYWCSFIVYLDRNVKVCPKSISQYLTGASWYLNTVFFIDTTFTKSNLIKKTTKGITNLWRAQYGNKESDIRRLGVPLDLVMSLCTKLRKNDSFPYGCALVFFRLAFQLLTRKSELLYSKENKHFLKVENVNFTFISTNSHPEKEISVTSIEAYKYDGNKNFKLQSVQIEIKDAKNDQQGNSHRYSFDRRPTGYDSTKTFCITTTTFCWAIVSRPSLARQPFLSFPIESQTDLSKRTYPSEDLLRNLLKDEASQLGLDPKRVTLHSLRIGAATTLAAKGASEHVIKNAGRWASDCFQRYIRDTVHMNARVSDFMQNADNYTIKDVKKWCVAHDIKDDKLLDEDD